MRVHTTKFSSVIIMTALKQLSRDGPCGASQRLLPSIQSPERATNPPLTVHMANLKDEALYLASVLRARLSESSMGKDGRGLLSRALARGELDQFLVDFFSDPENMLFAKEKVCHQQNI